MMVSRRCEDKGAVAGRRGDRDCELAQRAADSAHPGAAFAAGAYGEMVSEGTKLYGPNHLGDGPSHVLVQMWSEERTAPRASPSSPWMRV